MLPGVDAGSADVQQRGREEKIGHGVEFRCRLALMYAHVWGVNAHGASWHLRRTADGGLFDTHAGGFDAVWQSRRPVEGGVDDAHRVIRRPHRATTEQSCRRSVRRRSRRHRPHPASAARRQLASGWGSRCCAVTMNHGETTGRGNPWNRSRDDVPARNVAGGRPRSSLRAAALDPLATCARVAGLDGLCGLLLTSSAVPRGLGTTFSRDSKTVRTYHRSQFFGCSVAVTLCWVRPNVNENSSRYSEPERASDRR